MTFTERLVEQARRGPKRVIFPEAGETRVLQAARRICDLGITHPILVGTPEEIRTLAGRVQVSLEGFALVDTADEALRQQVIQEFLSASDLFSEKALNRKLKDPLNYAAAMVRVGRADCLAAGISHTTGDVVLTAQLFIGMEPGVETPSSLGICEIPGYAGSEGDMLVVTDCAVNMRPTSEELADIAIASSTTVKRLLNWEPRIAMLSFSTKGSSAHADVDKVVAAVELVRHKRPDLKVDGEFQLDAAILPQAAARKVPGEGPVAGRANILVFPDLGAGNIGVKLLQIFGHALAHGPLLQGFARPVTDFSRSAPVDEMVGNLTMLVVRAQETDE